MRHAFARRPLRHFAARSKFAASASWRLLSALQSTTGQEKKGKEFVGTPIVDANLNLVASVRGQQASIAEPLPSDVASAIGRPAGSTVLGRW